MITIDKHTDEAMQVRAAYDLLRRERRGFTQGQLAQEFECSQGLIQGWLRGSTHIPDRQLFRLSELLEFDALEVRPSLHQYITAAKKLMGNDDPQDTLRDLTTDMTPEELSAVTDYAVYIRTKRKMAG